MAIKTIKIDSFNRGISDDVRIQENGVFSESKHFDILTNPKRLTPYREQEVEYDIADTSSNLTEFRISNFLYSNSKLWALGQKNSGSALIRILEREFGSDTWSLSGTATQTDTGVPNTNTFIEYKNNIYGIKPGTANQARIWRYGDISTGARAISTTVTNLTTIDSSLTYAAQGIIGKDDNLYIPYENKLVRYNGTTWAEAVLTLPAGEYITSLTNWGNYIAIATVPRITYGGVSRVYFWDLVSPDVSEVIDWGEEPLYIIESLFNTLVGISVVSGGSSLVTNPRTTIKTYSGGGVTTIKELPYYGLGYIKAKKGDKLYFKLSDGTETGLWCVGRKNSEQPISVYFDRRIGGNVNVSTLNSFYFVSDKLFTSYNSTCTISATKISGASYSTTASYVTQKLTGDDPSKVKAIRVITLTYPALPSAGVITCKYRVNEETAWTTIFSDTTDNSISHEAVNIESTGRPFNDFKEMQIKVESTGGAELTSIKVQYEELDSQIENI